MISEINGIEFIKVEIIAGNKPNYRAMLDLFSEVHSLQKFIDATNIDICKWAIKENLITFHEAREICASFEKYVRNLPVLG